MAARLNAPRTRRKPTPGPAAPPREPVMGDNGREEAERVQLISFVSRLDAADVEVERAQGPYKAALANRSAIKKLAQGAGFTADELKLRRNEMAQSTADNARQAARESKHRRWLGIITAEQQEMHLGEATPQEARDEVDWDTEGYKRGLRGRAAEPLPDGMDARFTQPFLKGHERGWAGYLEGIAQNVPKPKGMTAQEVAAKAAAEFEADNPEIDVEAEARRLKASGFLNRSDPVVGDDFAGESLGSTATASSASTSEPNPTPTPDASTDTSPTAGTTAGAGPDDGFEATEEELAAQKPRQAVVDQREGNTTGADVV